MAPAAFNLSSTEFLNQLHGAVGSREGHFARQSLLETAAGIGAQAHAACAAAHGLRGEHRCLKPDAGRGVIHAAVVATDHASQSDGLIGVAHHPGFLAEAVLTGIEGLERFGGAAAAQIETSRIGLAATQGRQLCGIKGMQGLAELEHHQIGDVDHVVDGAQAGALQPVLQPLGRGSHLETVEGGDAEQATGFDAFLHRRLHGQGLGRNGRGSGRQGECPAAEGCHLAGDALHREAIGPVGGDRQLEHLIIETEQRTHRGAQGRHALQGLIEDHDPVGAIGQAQLREGADHAAAVHAAKFSRFDREIHRGQIGPHRGHSHTNPGPHVFRAAHNLQRLGGADVHRADAQLVGIGMLIAVLHMAHHHTGGAGGEILDLFHFKASHRQAFGELFGG